MSASGFVGVYGDHGRYRARVWHKTAKRYRSVRHFLFPSERRGYHTLTRSARHVAQVRDMVLLRDPRAAGRLNFEPGPVASMAELQELEELQEVVDQMMNRHRLAAARRTWKTEDGKPPADIRAVLGRPRKGETADEARSRRRNANRRCAGSC